jgi:hypothetical protein
MDATFDDLRVPLRGARGIGHVLEPARREQDGAERVANVVADDRENPPLEVAGERELLLIVLLLCLLSAAAKAVFHLERFAPVKMVTVQAAPTGTTALANAGGSRLVQRVLSLRTIWIASGHRCGIGDAAREEHPDEIALCRFAQPRPAGWGYARTLVKAGRESRRAGARDSDRRIATTIVTLEPNR